MGLALISFAAVFLLITSAGLLLFYREAMRKRLATVISPDGEQTSTFDRVRAGASVTAMVEPFEKIVPRSDEEVSVVQKRLIRAGYRQDSHLKYFYASKFLVPVSLCVLATVTGIYDLGPFFIYALCAGLGYLLPDFWLGNRISARQLDLTFGLPEALDFMVICIEAGLSLDQATMRTSEELKIGQPALSDELGLVILEQRAGRGRADSWKNLAERTDVDPIRSLVALIVQVDQFGTSIAKALRIHSDTLRTKRRQDCEEQAAKTAVKLVFPLVFFIFPSIFLVVLGPAMIIILESFEKYF
jgi:tight adherence protein C